MHAALKNWQTSVAGLIVLAVLAVLAIQGRISPGEFITMAATGTGLLAASDGSVSQ